MSKISLFVLKRYAVTDLGKAIVWCTTCKGEIDTLYIVKDPRHDYICVCRIAAYGHFPVPDCEYYYEMFDDFGAERDRVLQICFGPNVLPLPEKIKCRGNVS